MSKNNILLLICLLLYLGGNSQAVTVKDIMTDLPIGNVIVTNRSNTIKKYTDINGKVNLNDFEIKELIYFSHSSYSVEKRTISQIIENEYVVKMVNEILLPQVDIRPPRESVRKDYSTVRISKISSQDMKFSSPQTSADLLQKNSNILVQKSQSGGGSPIIRGFEANKILLVIDGVRLNNAIYRSGHLQSAITVDNNILENTDVFYGPGSVIYGSDALGGVIHFHTKKPTLSVDSNQVLKTNFLSRFGSANGENTNHIDFNIGNKKLASLTSVTHSRFSDFKMGTNRLHGYEDFGKIPYYVSTINGIDSMVTNTNSDIHKRTGYEQMDFLQKFTYKVNEEHSLGLNLQYSNSSTINRFDKLNEYTDGVLKYGEWYYGPQKRFLSALKLESKKEYKLADYYTIIAAFQKIDEDRISRKYQSSQLFTEQEDVFVYSLNADFLKKLSKKEVLYYGAEVSHNTVNSSATEKNINTSAEAETQSRYPSGENRISSFALYASMDKKLNQLLIATFGARYSHFINFSSFKDNTLIDYSFNEIKFNTGATSGSVSLKYEEKHGFRGELIASSGFRSPNVDDYGKVFEKDGELVVPNNNLKPEYVYNYELNFSKKWEKEDREYLAIKLAGFYTSISNAIVKSNYQINGLDSINYRGEEVNIVSNQNVNSAAIYGCSFDTRINFSPSLSFNGSINYTVGDNLTDETKLSHIPPLFGRAALSYSTKKIKLQLNTMFNGKKNLTDYGPGTADNADEATVDGTPKWTTFGINASYKIATNIMVLGSVENLFDVHYKQFASGISGLGRNFSLSIRGNF